MNSKFTRIFLPVFLVGAIVIAAFAFATFNSTESALAQGPDTQKTDGPSPIYRADGTIDVGPVLRNKDLPLETSDAPSLLSTAGIQKATYEAGDERIFLGLDNYNGFYFLTTYEVKLISDTVEVWVQTDLRYYNEDGTLNPIHPDADDPEHVTQERVEALAQRFQDEIIDTEVDYFGDYASRDGSGAVLPGLVGLPPNYYATDNGKRVILLVSNVRDGNFYDPVNNSSFIAGFFSPTLDQYSGRNVMTIDSKQWDERVGPPDFGFDAVIAHEFQHLINNDHDPDEDSWANEGRSELAEWLVGYRPTPESHRTTWSDYPENSLTQWGDQDDDPDQGFEILADYQEAYWFFLYLTGQLIDDPGVSMTNDQIYHAVAGTTMDATNGIESIEDMLTDVGASFTFDDVWTDFRSDNLYGGDSDGTSWGDYITTYSPPSGVPIAPLDLGRMRENLDFEGYDTPGAPPYGSDYIEIGWSNEITPGTTLTFTGTNEIETSWSTIAASSIEDAGGSAVPPSGSVSGDVLYSGHTDLADNFVIFDVTVPMTGNQMLSFDTLYDIEATWDYGFVQVTTDTTNAEGFTSLDLTGTMTETADGAHPVIAANVPGYSGADGWVNVQGDLSAYAGQNILLAFRYSTDWASSGNGVLENPGWYLDNVSVGGTDLFTETLPNDAMSIWQARGEEYDFRLDFVTFADGNGDAIANVYTTSLTSGQGTFQLGNLLSDAGFDESGERVVGLVSTIAPSASDDLISAPGDYGEYELTGLPPTLLTSRARMVGTATNSTTARPRVFPGDQFSVTVTVDNLGRNDDLSAEASDAYVAVPIPDYTSYASGSFTSTVAAGNGQYTADLSSVDSGLPAVPGVYWNGTVSDTADLAFALDVTSPLTIGTHITPTAHIANDMFNASPTQYFTDVENAVEVVSPLAFSAAEAPTMSVPAGQTASFTYKLVNTDDTARNVDFSFEVPAGTSLTGINFANETLSSSSVTQTGDQVNLTLNVPSFLNTGQAKVVTVELRIDKDYSSGTLTLTPQVLQPDSDIPYVEFDTEDATADVLTELMYMPLIFKQ